MNSSNGTIVNVIADDRHNGNTINSVEEVD